MITQPLATKEDIHDLRRNLKELEMRLTVRLGGIVATGLAAVAVIEKFFRWSKNTSNIAP